MENNYELMWKLLKRDLKEEYENASDHYKVLGSKSWSATVATYNMAIAMMKTLEEYDMEDLKGLE